jgi:hypothetical protein
MNISEALGWMKTLKARHAELVGLRDANSATRIQRYGDNSTEIKPEYDTKKLDKRVTLLAREIRILDEAIKRTNAATELPNFVRDDAVLGELEDNSK